MAKIMNIGVLDVSEIKEELAKEITELINIGLLVESDNSQVLLKDTKKKNIGSTLKLPSDQKVDFVLKNGSIEIDKDFLEGLSIPIVLLVNGKIIFDENVEVELMDKKIYKIVLNGEIISPRKLRGLIESRATINGKSSYFTNGYKYISGNTRLTDRFLKGLRSNVKLAFNKLLMIDEIDRELFENKIDSIQVLKKLILIEKNEEFLPYIDDNFNVDTIVIPNSENDVKYFDDDLIINKDNIGAFNKDVLFVEGNVEIYLDDDYPVSDHISHLICDTVICNPSIYNNIKGLLASEVKVEIIKGKILKNTRKMEISAEFKEEVVIKNMGKLIIKENIDIDNFNNKVLEIINYGVIEVPQELMGLVERKVKDNFGKIRELKSEAEVVVEEDNEDILYANIGDLKL